jgi:hypothetical protein
MRVDIQDILDNIRDGEKAILGSKDGRMCRNRS